VGQVSLPQRENWQKPSGHDGNLPAHVTQRLPPLPQAEFVSPGWQLSSSSQHPLGHVSKLQVAPWHAPPTHASPSGHAAQALPPVPQSLSVVPSWHTSEASQQPVGHVVALHVEALQAPPVQTSVGGQAVHSSPPVPQNVVVVPVWQTPLVLQQPVGHVDALHGGGSHVPALHVSPVGHARQVSPSVPQAPVVVPVSQKLRASQQPDGHVVASHGGPRHRPPEQLSAGGHGKQALPPVPQADVLVPDSQLPELSQQPVGQLVALQVMPMQDPDVHVSPGGHGSQVSPPLPHDIVVSPASQRPAPSQHPVGQVAALQGGGWHVPALQLSPGGHAVHAIPPLPHSFVVVPPSQKPSASQQPDGHVAGSHVGPLHTPAEQESAGGHGRQALPPVPQAEVLVPDSQSPEPSQQPEGQLMALQVVPWQEPAMHVSPGGQASQAVPPLPHDVELVPDSQSGPLQQPAGQVDALQSMAWQLPPRQTSPSGHARQALPPVPHAVGLPPVSQKPRVSQQPVGHEAASHFGP
jgi:hypothetical protein